MLLLVFLSLTAWWPSKLIFVFSTRSFQWEWTSQCDDMPCLRISFLFSSPCYVKFLFALTVPLLILYNCTVWLPPHLESPAQAAWEPSPPRSSLPAFALLCFSNYWHWICEMWTCLGVTNSMVTLSIWFVPPFPITPNLLFGFFFLSIKLFTKK